MLLIYSKNDQRMYALDDGGNVTHSWECRDEFEPGTNDAGEPRESLPCGKWGVWADQPGVQYGRAYGTFYINTGDARSRDIHGGGSSLKDPYSPRQGWRMTYGCLRMQNEDGEELSHMILDAGNEVLLTVQFDTVTTTGEIHSEVYQDSPQEGEAPIIGSEAKYSGSNAEDYLSWIKGPAYEICNKYKLPAACCVAQSAIESGWGQNIIGDFNVFGRKATEGDRQVVLNTAEQNPDGSWGTVDSGFKLYSSLEDAIKDWCELMLWVKQDNTPGPYTEAAWAYQEGGDFEKFVRSIASVYATRQTYADDILSTVKACNLVV
jgi:flagellum-specific peptidoglycan hydrolase FlgJ